MNKGSLLLNPCPPLCDPCNKWSNGGKSGGRSISLVLSGFSAAGCDGNNTEVTGLTGVNGGYSNIPLIYTPYGFAPDLPLIWGTDYPYVYSATFLIGSATYKDYSTVPCTGTLNSTETINFYLYTWCRGGVISVYISDQSGGDLYAAFQSAGPIDRLVNVPLGGGLFGLVPGAVTISAP